MKRKLLSLTVLFLFAAGNFAFAFPPADSCRLKIGMNLFSLSYADNQLPFVDLMKECAGWVTQDSSGTNFNQNTNVIDSIPKDADGYPLQLPLTINGQAQRQTLATWMARNITNASYPAGTYIVLYDGAGAFQFGYDAVVVSQAPGRIVLNVTPSNNGIFFKILFSDANDPIRNIRMLMPGTEFTYQSNPFNQAFLDKLAPFKTVRFMQWNNTNLDDNSSWNKRRMPAYYTQASYATDRQQSGVAYEHMIQLCNLAQKDLWVNVPAAADSDYIVKLAELVRDSLNPSLKIYLEYSNEVWNTMFPLTYGYVDTAAGPPAALNHSQKTAYFIKRVFDIWENVFGGQMPSRVIRVAATFQNSATVTQDIMNYLLANGSGADAISCGAYFMLVAPDYVYLDSLGASATVADVIQLGRARIASLATMVVQQQQTANQYGLPLIFYEGGQHLNIQQGGQPYADTIRATQTDTAMYNLYQELFRMLRDSTGAELFMHFHLAGGGVMGSLANIYDSTSQKYQALLDNMFDCDTALTAAETLFKPEEKILVYPNPFTASANLRITNFYEYTNYELKIYDALGREVLQSAIINHQSTISRHGLPAGIYFCKVTSGKQPIATAKLVISD